MIKCNSDVLLFERADLGSTFLHFTMPNLYAYLPFDPSADGTTENVLVQFTGSGSLAGTSDVVLLSFRLVSGGVSRLIFNQADDRSNPVGDDLQR